MVSVVRDGLSNMPQFRYSSMQMGIYILPSHSGLFPHAVLYLRRVHLLELPGINIASERSLIL